MACYVDSLTVLYLYDVRTSQETPVTGIVLLLYMQVMFVLRRKHSNAPRWPVTGKALLFISLFIGIEVNDKQF
jgi:hypothetical protein